MSICPSGKCLIGLQFFLSNQRRPPRLQRYSVPSFCSSYTIPSNHRLHCQRFSTYLHAFLPPPSAHPSKPSRRPAVGIGHLVSSLLLKLPTTAPLPSVISSSAPNSMSTDCARSHHTQQPPVPRRLRATCSHSCRTTLTCRCICDCDGLSGRCSYRLALSSCHRLKWRLPLLRTLSYTFTTLS